MPSEHPSLTPPVIELLCECFDILELKRVVGNMPEGRKLLLDLPEPLSLHECAQRLASALERQGRLREFLKHVRAQRPLQEPKILQLEHRIAGQTTPAGHLREAALAALGQPKNGPDLSYSGIDTLVSWAEGRHLRLWPLPGTGTAEVEVSSLLRAFSSDIPVLIVRGEDDATGWRWADDALRGAMAGVRGSTTRIEFLKDEGDLRNFVDRTLAQVKRPQWSWSPEAWLRLQRQAADLGKSVQELAQSAKVGVAVRALEQAAQSVENARFEVAVAGPFRAGKSTLINALLEVEVSPVGRHPTTAVAVEFENGSLAEAEIYFEDKPKQVGRADQAFLTQFATQEGNEDNILKVTLVRVRLPSPLLSQGVVLVDTPGLQDPNETMVNIAKFALERAHAILYVVDGSPFANGGAVLSQAIAHDIRMNGSGSGKKLVLLINKIDQLKEDQIEDLQKLLGKQLHKFGLSDLILGKPILLSADQAWKRVGAQDGPDGGLPAVKEILWKELLQQGEIGFRQLRGALGVLERATSDLGTLIAARRASGEEVKRLRTWAVDARRRVQQLKDDLRAAEAELRAQSQQALGMACQDAISAQFAELERIPINQPLPDSSQVEQVLKGRLGAAVNATWTTAIRKISESEDEAMRVMEEELRQARATLSALPTRDSLSPPLVQIRFKPADATPEGVNGGILGGVFGSMLAGTAAGGFWGALLGGLAALLMGAPDRRRRDLQRLKEEVQTSTRNAMAHLQYQMDTEITSQFSQILRRLDDRMLGYVGVLEARIHEAGGAPLSREEAEELRGYEEKTRMLRQNLGELTEEVFRVGMQRR